MAAFGESDSARNYAAVSATATIYPMTACTRNFTGTEQKLSAEAMNCAIFV